MSVIVYESELYHHGVLGQKWGVRRYQNADGSLTKKGAKRYQKELKKQMKKEAKKDRNTINKKDLSIMSDQELRENIQRERLEKRYTEMFAPSTVTAGQKEVQNILETSGKLLDVSGKTIEVVSGANKMIGKKSAYDLDSIKKDLEETKKTVDSVAKSNRENIERQEKHKPRPDLSNYSIKDLQDKVNRSSLEQQYNKEFNTNVVKTGHDRVMDALAVAGSALVVAGTAIEVMNAFNRRKKEK